MSIADGKILLDKYKILRLIGSGAWGDVYLAQDIKLGRQVAIKHLKGELAEDEIALERFLREARAIAALKHPNVLIIYALEREDEAHYIVMEYAEKGTLGSLLMRSPEGLPVDQAIDIFIDVCRGLEAVHHKGIVHRDIKPDNVLLFADAEGQVPKLSDFGVARAPIDGEKARLTLDGQLVGTVSYMSPEQARGAEIDERSDLYSLGTLFYEMLTGKPPYEGNPLDVLMGHTEREPVPPCKRRGDIPISLEQVILKALAKVPSERYQTAGEMRQALEDVKLKEAKRVELGHLYERGVQYFHKGEWQDAIKILQEVHAVDPNYEDVGGKLKEAETRERRRLQTLYKEGLTSFKEGKWEDAIEKLSIVAASDPEYEDAAGKLQEAKERVDLERLYKQGLKHFEEGEWYEAIRCFIGVVTRDPDHTEATGKLEESKRQQTLEIVYKQGLKYLNDGNWPGATAKFSEVISVDAEYRDASENLEEAKKQWELERLYNEALELLDRRDWGQAVVSLQSIMELEPSYKDAETRWREAEHEHKLQNLYEDGMRHFSQGNWQNANESFKELSRLQPDYQDVKAMLENVNKQLQLTDLYDKAIECEKAEEWEEARQIVLEILNIDPEYKDVPAKLAKVTKQGALKRLYDRALDLLAASEWQEAATKLKQIVDQDPKYKDAVNQLKEAEKHAHSEDLYIQGTNHLGKGEWQKAIEIFQEINGRDPGYRDVGIKLQEVRKKKELKDLYTEGMRCYSRSDWQGAIWKFERLLYLSPEGYRDAKHMLEEARKFQEGEILPSVSGPGLLSKVRTRWQAQSDPVKTALISLFGVFATIFGGLGGIVLESCLNRTPTPTPTAIVVASPTSAPTAIYTLTLTPTPKYSLAVPSPLASLRNGNFETSDFVYWGHGGELSQSVQSETIYEGEYAMLLGSPDYPCLEGVSVGEAWVCQRFRVPSDGTPELSFSYRVCSFDVEGSDSLDIYIDETLIQQIWNTEWEQSDCDPNENGIQGEEDEAWDTGWRLFSYALDDYKGQAITLCFRNVNKIDSSWNTWSYVDDVKVTP